MRIQDITTQILDAIERGNVRSMAKYFTDDFSFTGPMPVAQDKTQFMDMMTKITNAVPDWKFNRHDLEVEGQSVHVPVQVTGTKTRRLPALMPGMSELQPTNRSFQIPSETLHVTFRGDRISNIHVDPVPGGGIPGMLEQLGAAIPVTGRKDQTSE